MDISEIERKIKEFKAKGLEWNVGYSEWRGEWGRIIYYIEEQVKLPSGEWISKYKIRVLRALTFPPLPIHIFVKGKSQGRQTAGKKIDPNNLERGDRKRQREKQASSDNKNNIKRIYEKIKNFFICFIKLTKNMMLF